MTDFLELERTYWEALKDHDVDTATALMIFFRAMYGDPVLENLGTDSATMVFKRELGSSNNAQSEIKEPTLL